MLDLTLALTVGVPLAILIYIVRSDRFPEPSGMVLKTFFIGVAIIIPAGFLNSFIVAMENSSGYDLSFLAGFTEEPLKFLAFMLFVFSNTDFDEPMDAIVYGAAIGLGYAAMENIPYLNTGDPETAWTMTIVKARYYPLIMHLGFGVLMGWLLSQNLFEERSSFKRKVMLILSLALPVLFHGSYNYLQAYDVFPILTLIMIVGIIYYYRRDQLKKITESVDKARVDNMDVLYSYLITLFFVSVVVLSAIFVNN